MSTQPVPYVTPEEYLEFDRKSDTRHEYVFGEIVPVTGAIPWHGLIVGNMGVAVGKRIFAGPCRMFVTSLRVCLDRQTSYGYPDVAVVCGPLEYLDDHNDTVMNPKLIAEVLSPSTRNYDLGDKARMYSRIPSLEELLLIDQGQIWIEHWRRQPNGHWDIEVVEDPQAIIRLDSLGCEAPVSEIYMGVEFPAA